MNRNSDEDSEECRLGECSNSPARKKKKTEHREQKYRIEWQKNTKDFGPNVSLWLKPCPDNDCKAKCMWCGLTLTANVTNLKDHQKSKRHKNQEKGRAASTSTVMTQFLAKSTPSPLDKTIKEAEIKLSAFLPAHNISFNTIDHLIPTLKACFPDSPICQGIQLKRKKCTNIVTNVIGASHADDLCAKLKNTKFSVLTDESTNIYSKTSCVMVRFYDISVGRIVTRFYDLHDVFPKGNVTAGEEGATGARLYELLKKSFDDKGVPMQNVIGFGCDSASSNIGEFNSIISRLRIDCPGIILMKCICHSLHRASSHACKILPRTCEDLVKNVFSYFRQSAKRLAHLKQFQVFVQVQEHEMLGLSITRWLSFLPAIQRMLEQWDALGLYFTDAWMSERTIAAEQMHKALHDPFIKLYYMFLAWILPKITHMNAFFQSEKVIVTSLHDKMEIAYKELLATYMRNDYVAKTALQKLNPQENNQFVRLENMYLGVQVAEGLKKAEIAIRPDLILYFKQKCREYLCTLCIGIKERFTFGDPLLTAIKILTPDKALSIMQRDATPSILFLCDLCPRAQLPENMQQLDDEWRRLPFENIDEDVRNEQEVDVFWHKVRNISFSVEEDKKYAILADFALSILTLPHSNADSERLFSKNKLTKTTLRNKLSTKTVKGCLLSSQCVKTQSTKCCYGFTPTSDMLSRMTSAFLYAEADSIDDDLED